MMYSIRNESTSVIAERFLRILKDKINNKMTPNNSKTFLGHLNKLVDDYNNTYHCFFNKKHINVHCSAFTEEIQSSHKAPKFKAGNRVRTSKYKNIFTKGYTRHWSQKTFPIDSVMQTNPRTNNVKDLNRKKNDRKLS